MEAGGNSRDAGSPANQGVAPVEAVDSRPRQAAWKPSNLAFSPYVAPGRSVGEGLSQRSSGLRVMAMKPLVSRLTKDIAETFQTCNPDFRYSEAFNPKRFLTSPHIGVLNEGFDNANSDLILSVNFVLVNEASQQRYVVKEMLGQGTFGQVAKCWVSETSSYVAVKVIKNQPAYYHQAIYEVNILRSLNQRYDPDKHHIVRMLDCFVYHNHLCISFEMLGSNLYELLKMNQLKGLSLSLLQMFSKQILQALVVMKGAGVIHCDLKPENILLWTSVKPPGIKVIDFGSACREGQTVYSYIQSRYYRSPEVLLGYPYTTAIDMWSLGCIVAELFLGLPLFPGASEYDLLKRMIEVIGGHPPDAVLRDAKNTDKFFMYVGSIHHLDNKEACRRSPYSYRLLTEEEYEAREQKKPVIGKWYFNKIKLEEIVVDYPYRRNLSEEEKSRERSIRLALIDFLRGLFEFDPEKRWTPLQASGHPFVTGEPFTCPYNPHPATSHVPVVRNIFVDNGNGQDRGHWFPAGLSPQVSNFNLNLLQHNPRFQMIPFSHGSSYGSLGSYGSYSENPCLGGSYGSYGDSSFKHTYYSLANSSGPSIPMQIGGSALGASPNARAAPQYPYGPGFGMSPSGTLRPMSLGVSPSQFTPPSSQIQVSSISPGKYGPPSPARGGMHGSPLGKAAAVGQYNKRRNFVHPASFPMQPPETSQHWQGHYTDGFTFSYEGSSTGHAGSPCSSTGNQPSWRKGVDGSDFSSGVSPAIHQNPLSSNPGNSSDVLLHSSESSPEDPECSSPPPDPGNWDPYYSDELLLQEDSPAVNNLSSGINSLHIGPSTDPAVLTIGAGRFNSGNKQCYTNPNSVSSNKRSNAQVQAYSNAEGSQSSVPEIHSGYSHPFSMPHHTSHSSQNSPSRFGQPIHQANHMQSTLVHGERNSQRERLARPSYSSTGSHSSVNSAFGSSMAWGQRTGHPIPAITPSSHSRNDHRRYP